MIVPAYVVPGHFVNEFLWVVCPECGVPGWIFSSDVGGPFRCGCCRAEGVVEVVVAA